MATSKLQRQTFEEIKKHFGQFEISMNHRPGWLQGLELDVFIVPLLTAIEIQGKQHYEFVEYFHRSYQGFRQQKQRDARKQKMCKSAGVDLFYVFDALDIMKTIKEICKRHDIEQIAVDYGWQKRKKPPETEAAKNRIFRCRITELLRLEKAGGDVDEMILKAQRLLIYVKGQNLTLTKGYKRVFNRILIEQP